MAPTAPAIENAHQFAAVEAARAMVHWAEAHGLLTRHDNGMLTGALSVVMREGQVATADGLRELTIVPDAGPYRGKPPHRFVDWTRHIFDVQPQARYVLVVRTSSLPTLPTLPTLPAYEVPNGACHTAGYTILAYDLHRRLVLHHGL